MSDGIAFGSADTNNVTKRVGKYVSANVERLIEIDGFLLNFSVNFEEVLHVVGDCCLSEQYPE